MKKFSQKIEKILEKSVQELTADDIIFLKKNGLINGCWGQEVRGKNNNNALGNIFAKISQILVKMIRPVFFEASCDLHDFGYWKGWDEARRLECDKKFYEAILNDINKQYYPWIWYYYQKTEGKIEAISFFEYFFKKNFYKILAKLFYIAVRIGGKKYFNYF